MADYLNIFYSLIIGFIIGRIYPWIVKVIRFIQDEKKKGGGNGIRKE